MSVKYEVTAITGKYTDASGKEKNRYTKVGVVVDSKNGPMLKLECVPIGWDGWAYLNAPRPRDEQKPAQSAAAPSPFDAGGEEIPF